MSLLNPTKKKSKGLKRCYRCYDMICPGCDRVEEKILTLWTNEKGDIKNHEDVECPECKKKMKIKPVVGVRLSRKNMIKQLKHDHKMHKKVMTKHNKFWKERGYEEEFGPKDFRYTRDEY